MSAVVELLLQAASGATVQFPPELARQLLDCSTDAAQRLAQAVRRFERALLPALQSGRKLALTPHESALWRAYQVSGARLLRSSRKLYSLLLLY
jgi:hypothetical protein